MLATTLRRGAALSVAALAVTATVPPPPPLPLSASIAVMIQQGAAGALAPEGASSCTPPPSGVERNSGCAGASFVDAVAKPRKGEKAASLSAEPEAVAALGTPSADTPPNGGRQRSKRSSEKTLSTAAAAPSPRRGKPSLARAAETALFGALLEQRLALRSLVRNAYAHPNPNSPVCEVDGPSAVTAPQGPNCHIIGVDETGVGPLAGPMVAAAVWVPLTTEVLLAAPPATPPSSPPAVPPAGEAASARLRRPGAKKSTAKKTATPNPRAPLVRDSKKLSYREQQGTFAALMHAAEHGEALVAFEVVPAGDLDAALGFNGLGTGSLLADAQLNAAARVERALALRLWRSRCPPGDGNHQADRRPPSPAATAAEAMLSARRLFACCGPPLGVPPSPAPPSSNWAPWSWPWPLDEFHADALDAELMLFREGHLRPRLMVLLDGGGMPQRMRQHFAPNGLRRTPGRPSPAAAAQLQASEARRKIVVDPLAAHSCAQCLVGGDDVSFSVALASIVASVVRHRHMMALDAAYPQYGFGSHQGYSCRTHLEAIRKYGPTPAHRTNIASVALAIAEHRELQTGWRPTS